MGDAPPSGARLGDIWVNPKDGAELVYVPAGPFKMGEHDDPDNPLRTVKLDGFWIYKNLVTKSQYRKFCVETGRMLGIQGSVQGPDAVADDYPIGLVDWAGADAYAKWAGVRLPTEAEWEKAARGTDGRLYPWGNKFDKNKLYLGDPDKDYPSDVMSVGKYPSGASWCGALDMVGNSHQWCADWYDEKYPKSAPTINPTGPASGVKRVVRGHHWWIGRSFNVLTCFTRSGFKPDEIGLSLGFRCAISVSQSQRTQQ